MHMIELLRRILTDTWIGNRIDKTRKMGFRSGNNNSNNKSFDKGVVGDPAYICMEANQLAAILGLVRFSKRDIRHTFENNEQMNGLTAKDKRAFYLYLTEKGLKRMDRERYVQKQ